MGDHFSYREYKDKEKLVVLLANTAMIEVGKLKPGWSKFMDNNQMEIMLNRLAEQQQKLDAQLSGLSEHLRQVMPQGSKADHSSGKDVWDRTAALAPIISAVVIALIGAYFTVTYNQQQLKLQEIQTIERFIPHLMGNEKSKRAAILAIQSLGNTHLAAKVASIFASEGTVSALQSIAKSGDNKDKELVSGALAKTLDNLADNYADESNYSQAIDKYIQALAIRKGVLPDGHPEIADDLEKLANLYDSRGDKMMAQELRKRILAMRNHITGGQASGAEQPSGCVVNLSTTVDGSGKTGTTGSGAGNVSQTSGNSSNTCAGQDGAATESVVVPPEGSRQ